MQVCLCYSYDHLWLTRMYYSLSAHLKGAPLALTWTSTSGCGSWRNKKIFTRACIGSERSLFDQYGGRPVLKDGYCRPFFTFLGPVAPSNLLKGTYPAIHLQCAQVMMHGSTFESIATHASTGGSVIFWEWFTFAMNTCMWTFGEYTCTRCTQPASKYW